MEQRSVANKGGRIFFRFGTAILNALRQKPRDVANGNVSVK